MKRFFAGVLVGFCFSAAITWYVVTPMRETSIRNARSFFEALELAERNQILADRWAALANRCQEEKLGTELLRRDVQLARELRLKR